MAERLSPGGSYRLAQNPATDGDLQGEAQKICMAEGVQEDNAVYILIRLASPCEFLFYVTKGNLHFCGETMMGSSFGAVRPVRRNVFVSYHHGGDQAYYDTLTKTMHDRLQLITDNSLERRIDSSDHNYIMRRIREYHLHGSSCTIVLCGANTWRRKYVDWEIHASLIQQMGLVGVWLPSLPLSPNNGTDKPARLQDNIDCGYAVWTSWNEIAANANVLTEAIERANSASKLLIENTRVRQGRNL
ncbi:TIR domain-containing protein [Cereibacter johrii]|uniref:TIR domain-containing protein n=1 Tax=Cereibacter johrii TaxID=445629 RepID=UPI001B8745DD|nr:TIR domain-containing protein [Cereibacter johrii]